MTRVMRFLFLACGLSSVPAAVFAQEAALTGTVTDATGAVLPGVTVTAVNDATGNTFDAVTDERGIYRMPVRVGGYHDYSAASGILDRATNRRAAPGRTDRSRERPDVSVDGPGNGDRDRGGSPAQRDDIESGWQRQSDAGAGAAGQRQELDGAGAAGSRQSRTASTNATTPLPDRNGGEAREFQLNMDGQQVSNEIGTGAQPRYSQDAIAEFQFVSNRFDATQGRTSGVQVNAITKSGTNQFSGLFRGNFRNSRFNAEEPGARPRRSDQNQQLSAARGGPIFSDRLHYFGNFEYEREPRSSIWNTPYPVFNVELHGKAPSSLAASGRLPDLETRG